MNTDFANSQVLRRNFESASLFRDSPYVRALNALLRKESQATALCRALMRQFPKTAGLGERTAAHFANSRLLVLLIARQRGLASPQASLEYQLEQTLFRRIALVPGLVVWQRLCMVRLRGFHRKLLQAYEQIKDLAPASDLEELEEAQENLEETLLRALHFVE